MARTQFTKSSLHLQLAGWILVRNPCGDPGPAALGTGAPLGALLWTGGRRRDQPVLGSIPRSRWPHPVWPHGWKEGRYIDKESHHVWSLLTSM